MNSQRRYGLLGFAGLNYGVCKYDEGLIAGLLAEPEP